MSSAAMVVVKWGKETVELSTAMTADEEDWRRSVQSFKRALYTKTGVPPERQKIMCKVPKNMWKGVLKDDDNTTFCAIDWNASGKDVQLLLMGSAEALQVPTQATVFLEDLKEEDKAVIADPAGLVNLGNTCYLNSVVQCLRVIPQLQQSLQSFQPILSSVNNSVGVFFTKALAETYAQLGRQTLPLQPIALVQATKLAFPQFAQLGPHGHPMQQDAEEFYSGILTLMSSRLNNDTATTGSTATSTDNNHNHHNNKVDAIFGMRLKETLTCDEFCTSGDAAADDAAAALEPPVVSFDFHRKLVCNIQGGSDGNQNTVNYINEGIVLGLTGKIVKRSDVLDRDAVWTRSQRIAKLPVVLVVQFGRFYWKVNPDSADHQGVKCKVMKPVAFGDTLDVYDFCTPEIQAVLKQSRSLALAMDEAAIQRKLDGKGDGDDANMKDATVMDDAKMDESQAAADDDDDDQEDLRAALAMSLEAESAAESNDAAALLGPGLPTDFQGHYELFAVVTHKGRDADGGHYMAWVKSDHQSSSTKIADSDLTNEDWYVFDDDEVSPCKTEDVLKLKGGGDWHMSYLNFYRVKK